MTVLPNKLSDLIELAIRDVQKCEAEPARFRLAMGNWHMPVEDGICEVCLAGAVMAQTLALPDTHYVSFAFDGVRDFQQQLRALNDVRVGDMVIAVERLGIKPSLAQSVAIEDAESIIFDGLPIDSGLWEECCGEMGEYEHVNADDFHAPWPVYLEAAAVLREASL